MCKENCSFLCSSFEQRHWYTEICFWLTVRCALVADSWYEWRRKAFYFRRPCVTEGFMAPPHVYI